MVVLEDNTERERSPPLVENGFANGPKAFQGNGNDNDNDTLSYANVLRARNKFSDALALYETILNQDINNVEAHIGKGICLQTQSKANLAFDCFSEAIRLDPHNACALTHCGILHKEEGRLVEAAEVCDI